MKSIRKWMGLLLALSLCACLFGCESNQLTVDHLTYSLENGEATLIRFQGGANEVTVPDSVNGCPVTAIGEGAFLSAKALRAVSLPQSLRRIDAYAFGKCAALVSVVCCGEQLAQIGEGAFASCAALEDVILPQGVESIGREAFTDCAMLTRVTLPGTLKTIGDRAFSQCPALCDVQLPPAIEQMGEHVFVGHGEYLRLVVFEDTVGQRYAEEYGLATLMED